MKSTQLVVNAVALDRGSIQRELATFVLFQGRNFMKILSGQLRPALIKTSQSKPTERARCVRSLTLLTKQFPSEVKEGGFWHVIRVLPESA